MQSRLRCLILTIGGFLSCAVNAEVPQPQQCEQLYVVLGHSGVLEQQWLEELAKKSGLQLHAHPRTDASLRDFAAGVHDLWLGATLDTLRDSAAHPLQPALWQEEYWLWFRAGELTDLQQLPQLSGLRGSYWRQQHKRGLLVALSDAEQLRLLPSPNHAVQLLLAGEVDYFLASRDELEAATQALERLEAFAEPVLVRPYYLAFSHNSACLEPKLVKKLSTAIRKLQQ